MVIRVGIVAGEASGDQLAAGLITALRQRVADIRFEGVAGPAMIAAGCAAIYPSDRLAVMGLVEPLARLPELLRMRRALFKRFERDPPDVFIGVDAPDFNLSLERRLRARGIKTVHYVSPSVWAWRQGRIRSIARSVDLMLTLFPFEADFYHQHKVPVRFVGHPFADLVPMEVDRGAARRALGIAGDARVVAVLPGSRAGEVSRLGEPFLQAAVRLAQRIPELMFVAPMAGPGVRAVFESLVSRMAPSLNLMVLDGRAREAMAAADAVLLASGTAALEALLLKRPMVVAYRVAALTYAILNIFRMLKVRQFSLPNLLAGEALVPEFIQGDVTAEHLADAVAKLLDEPQRAVKLQKKFAEIHGLLRRDASAQAADAVLQLVGPWDAGGP